MGERFTDRRGMRSITGAPPVAAIPDAMHMLSHPLPGEASGLNGSLAKLQATRTRNREQVRHIWEYQQATGTACFFASLFSLSDALRPGIALPDADCYLADIRPRYHDLLDPEKLLVRHDRLDEALRILEEPEWGMRVKRITRNEKARQLLEANLKPLETAGRVIDTGTNAFIKPEEFVPPFIVWMHEGITNQAHFITVDGTPDAAHMVQEYAEVRKYFPKMVIEAELSGTA